MRGFGVRMDDMETAHTSLPVSFINYIICKKIIIQNIVSGELYVLFDKKSDDDERKQLGR